jgi:ATP:corrinoid adenosyltransferase
MSPSTDSETSKRQRTDDGSDVEELEGGERAYAKRKSAKVQERKRAPKRQRGNEGQEQWEVPAVRLQSTSLALIVMDNFVLACKMSEVQEERLVLWVHHAKGQDMLVMHIVENDVLDQGRG